LNLEQFPEDIRKDIENQSLEILESIARYTHNNPEVSVLFSSHITTDLERICNRAIILEQGRIVSDTQIKTGVSLGDTAHLTLEEKFLNALTPRLIQ